MFVPSKNEISQYIQAVERFPSLAAAEELSLAQRWSEHGDRTAANELVEANLRYVVRIAYKYQGYGFSLSDLIAEGNVGLLEAVRRFEPERKLRFMTYAAYWVRAMILSYVLKHWSIVGVGTGPLQSKMFFRLQAERGRLSTKLGGDTQKVYAALAAKFKTSEEVVRKMSERLSGRDSSLDAAAFRDSEVRVVDLLPDEGPDIETRFTQSERDTGVQEVLSHMWGELSDREQVIVSERLLQGNDGASLASLGRKFGLSRERVRQLEARLKDKLRQALA